MPQNGCGILGNYFFTKSNEEGEHVSLTPDECQALMAHVAANRQVRHAAGEAEIHFFDSIEGMERFKEQRRDEEKQRN